MTRLNTGKSQSGIRTMHSPFLRVVPNARPPAIIIDDSIPTESSQNDSPFHYLAIAVVLICAMATVVTVSMSAAASVATLLIQHR